MKNPPAFPRAAFAPANVGYEDVGIHDSQEGMRLRDWFAGQALTGILACDAESDTWMTPTDAAARSYELADAMLKEREAKT